MWADHICLKWNAHWKKLVFCWITPESTWEFLFSQCWKFTFPHLSSVSYSHLFAYYPGLYSVDSVSAYRFWRSISVHIWYKSSDDSNFDITQNGLRVTAVIIVTVYIYLFITYVIYFTSIARSSLVFCIFTLLLKPAINVL